MKLLLSDAARELAALHAVANTTGLSRFPRMAPVVLQRGAHDELGFRLLQSSKERVRVETGFGAERAPTPPDSVFLFVGGFLL